MSFQVVKIAPLNLIGVSMKYKIPVILGCSLLVACSVKQVEPNPLALRKPDFVVAFEPASAAFNNVTPIRQALHSAPVVVLIVNANQDTADLAEDRISSLTRVLEHKEVYVSYLYSDRPADAQMVEVFGVKDASAVEAVLASVNKVSIAAQAGRVFAEQSVRRLNQEVRRKTFAFDGRFDETATQQLIQIINTFGWSVKAAPVFKTSGKVLAAKSIEMDLIVVDEKFATQIEVAAIVDSWLRTYGINNQGYGVAFDKVSRNVVVSSI